MKREQHRHARHGQETPTYISWRSMRERCRKHSAHNAKYYDGISVCDRWLSFENFLSDMGERPDGTSIDRIDSKRGYEPGNCRWATISQQARNTRNAKLTLETATEAVLAYMRGESALSVARRYGCSQSLVREISYGNKWRDALAAAITALSTSRSTDKGMEGGNG